MKLFYLTVIHLLFCVFYKCELIQSSHQPVRWVFNCGISDNQWGEAWEAINPFILESISWNEILFVWPTPFLTPTIVIRSQGKLSTKSYGLSGCLWGSDDSQWDLTIGLLSTHTTSRNVHTQKFSNSWIFTTAIIEV